MKDEEIIDAVNARSPGFIAMMGGKVTAFNAAEKTCTFVFDISTDFCHSVNVVQGGFVTAMLDAAMSHALFMSDESVATLSSLEIKTSYLEPSLAGVLTVTGKVIKAGYKTVFMEGQMFNADGVLTATASSVGKIGRKS